MKSIQKRLLLIIGLAAFAIYWVTPTVVYFSMPKESRNDVKAFEENIPDWLHHKKHIKLGLDLQGGVQLVLGVDTDTAIKNKISRIGTEMTRWANSSSKQIKTAYASRDGQTLQVDLEKGVDVGDFVVEALKEVPGLAEVRREDQRVSFQYDDNHLKQIKRAALNQAEKVIRSRVDKWGVSEPSISRRFDGTILVQLPGFKDPAKARELLGRTAQLKFMLLNEESTAFSELTDNLPEGISFTRRGNFNAISFASESKQAILDHIKGKVPEGSEVLFEVEPIAGGKKSRFISHLLYSATELSGEDVLDAQVYRDTSSFDNKPAVSLKFTGTGGKRFGEITGDNIQKRMAIVLDNIVVSDPTIQTRIGAGSAQITLGAGQGYNQQMAEAQDLALILKSGALPAPITILEERQVGASLGPELANQGVLSVGVGLVLVLIYMIGYYQKPGFLSSLALVLNGLFLVALMALFDFSLTLPGFAGLILTLGMGVDANVLINERIRQELRDGKSAVKAVEQGFDKVFWTIIDSNVTTLIAALVLLNTNSSGPIKGFSVALIIGILVSMFTSLFCSKIMFQWVISGDKQDSIKKAWLGAKAASKHKNRNWDFVKYGRRTAIIGSICAVVIFISGGFKGMNWAVDFAGGTEVEITFQKEVESQAIREVLEAADIRSPSLQTVGKGHTHYLIRFEKALKEQSEDIRSLLNTKLSQYGPQLQRVDFVGPLIGKELQTQGVMSVGWSILGILIYVGLRFDMRFGPGAVLKMLQDVIIIMGFYIFFQRSFDLTSVAALLTAIGYSVNDTIVIYDRIRENLSIHPRKSLYENINLSINETLTRTLNTSVTTIIALGGILIFASSQIWNFAAAMVIGVISATLTSTFLASSILIWTEKWRSARAATK